MVKECRIILGVDGLDGAIDKGDRGERSGGGGRHPAAAAASAITQRGLAGGLERRERRDYIPRMTAPVA